MQRFDAGSGTAFLSAIGGAGSAGGNPFTGFTCFVNNGKLGEMDALTVSGNMLLRPQFSSGSQSISPTTKPWTVTCRQLILTLSDGPEHKANFKFK
jgi:hypothetical protein